MADGIISLATVIMAGAIKKVSVEHGLDPREFVLFCYGGGGPLHASALARELSIPTVVIPPEPGNFSAVGMLLADARLDVSKTFTGALDDATVASLKDAFADMEEEARAMLVRDFGAGEVLFERFGEMRYVGQRHNIKVPLPDTADPSAIRASFDRDYKRRYGHADARANAEFQALHLSAFSRLRRPELKWLPRAQGGDRNLAAAIRLFRRRRQARGRHFRSHGAAARFLGPGPGLDRGIRIDDPDLARRPLRGGRAGRAAHPMRAELSDAGSVRSNDIVAGRRSDHARGDPPRPRLDHQSDRRQHQAHRVLAIYLRVQRLRGRPRRRRRQLVAQCTGGMPPFVADSVGMAVRDGLQIYGKARLHHGDVVLCNHAAVQGQHLNNTVMYTPIFAGPGRATLIGFFAINVHWIDIGGIQRNSTDIFMEGLQLRSIKLWSKGEPIEEVYRIIENNTRMPNELMGDIAAQLAGCLLGRDLTAELIDKYGVGDLRARGRNHPRPVGSRGARVHPRDAGRRL